EGALNEEQMKTAGIPANFVRFSVGLEHIEDLKKDVLQALQEV
ncbi:PLP-dependent transferase, partial [Pseudoalteromonas sp. 2103]|nr:PLP-dependent transferase [Pseudoalteromonas sp. 2103]